MEWFRGQRTNSLNAFYGSAKADDAEAQREASKELGC